MIEIASLFLGLVYGPQRVELDVSPDVVAVEIVLDGEFRDRIDGPPWSARIDLGSELRTHRLEVVALDAENGEIDRAERLLNLGHRRQGGRMMLLEDSAGRPEAVSLAWESVGQRQNVAVEVFLDGVPVPWDDPRRVLLPDYTPDDFHVVSAVFHFADGGTSSTEIGFGGRLGLEVSTELTAVVVRPSEGGRPVNPRRPQSLASAFRLRDGGGTVPVHGIEAGRAEIVLVRDVGVQHHFERLTRRVVSGPNASARQRRALFRTPTASQPDPLLSSRSLQRFAGMPPETRLRFVAPLAAPLRPIGVSANMFLISEPIGGEHDGLLSAAVRLPPQQFDKQLAAAVALAGKIAQGSQRPRAVVLILGQGGTDVSGVSPENARAYLRDLGVPLHVWAFEPLPETLRDSGWGPIRSLGPPDDPSAARDHFADRARELADDLSRQRLVWLTGSHLPREIEVAPGADGLEIVGRRIADAGPVDRPLDR